MCPKTESKNNFSSNGMDRTHQQKDILERRSFDINTLCMYSFFVIIVMVHFSSQQKSSKMDNDLYDMQADSVGIWITTLEDCALCEVLLDMSCIVCIPIEQFFAAYTQLKSFIHLLSPCCTITT